MLRNLVTRLAIVLVIATLLIPATATETMAKTRVVVWDWSVHSRQFYQEQFARFNQEQDEIEVRFVVQPSSRYDLLLQLGFESGNPPDIFMTGDLVKHVRNGWVRSLDDLVTQEWRESFPPGAFVEGETIIGNQLYSFPFFNNKVFNVRPLFINVDLFEQAGLPGPPTTWSEFREYAKRITDMLGGNGWGFAIGSRDPSMLELNVGQLAAVAGNTDGWGYDYSIGGFRFHDQSILDAYALLKDMEKDGSIMPGMMSMDDETARIQFGLGRVGMIIGGWWNPGTWEGYDVQFAAAPLPVPDSGRGGYQYAPPPNASWVIASDSPRAEAAWKVLEFISSLEVHTEYVKQGLGFSIFPDANKAEYFEHEAQAQMIQIAESDLINTPLIEKNEEWMSVYRQPIHPDFSETLVGAWLGRFDLEEALIELSDTFNAEWARAVEQARADGVDITLEDLIIEGWRDLDAKE